MDSASIMPDPLQGVLDFGGNSPASTSIGPPAAAKPELVVDEVVVVEKEYDKDGNVTKETRTISRPRKLTPVSQPSLPPRQQPNPWVQPVGGIYPSPNFTPAYPVWTINNVPGGQPVVTSGYVSLPHC